VAHGSTPLVTILTPAHNRADYLPETIESVLGQSYANIEYIVLDDGSTDDTPQVLANYRDRIAWVTHPNMGEARTVNRGLKLAKGEFIGVVNSDDPILPGLVEIAVEELIHHPGVLVVYPDWVLIDPESRPVKTVFAHDYDYLDMLRWHHCIPGPGAMFRRRALELGGYRDETYRYVGDFEFWLRVGLHGPFLRIARPLATFRMHPLSASLSDRGELMAEEHVRLVREYFARGDLPERAKHAQREVLAAAYFTAGAICLLSARSVARGYMVRALQTHPLSFLRWNKRGWLVRVLASLLPDFAYSRARALWRKVGGGAPIWFEETP